MRKRLFRIATTILGVIFYIIGWLVFRFQVAEAKPFVLTWWIWVVVFWICFLYGMSFILSARGKTKKQRSEEQGS